jgi:hypothetical protein
VVGTAYGFADKVLGAFEREAFARRVNECLFQCIDYRGAGDLAVLDPTHAIGNAEDASSGKTQNGIFVVATLSAYVGTLCRD